MSPQASLTAAQKGAEATASPPTTALTKHELPAHQAKYLVKKTEMEEFLQKTFGAGLDFNVSVSKEKEPERKRKEREPGIKPKTPGKIPRSMKRSNGGKARARQKSTYTKLQTKNGRGIY